MKEKAVRKKPPMSFAALAAQQLDDHAHRRGANPPVNVKSHGVGVFKSETHKTLSSTEIKSAARHEERSAASLPPVSTPSVDTSGASAERSPAAENVSTDTLWVDPKDITPIEFHDRLYLVGIDDLARSMQGGQQQEPCRIRRSRAAPTQYELIVGRRRLEAAKLNNEKLWCYLVTDNDDEAFLSMWKENQGREDLSVIERAVSLQRALDEKRFESAIQMAHKLGLSRSNMSDILRPAGLPQAVRESITNPSKYGLVMAREMAIMCDQGYTDEVIATLPKIESDEGLPVRQIRRYVMALRNKDVVSQRRLERKRNASTKLINDAGAEIGRYRVDGNGEHVFVLTSKLSQEVVTAIMATITKQRLEPKLQ